MPRPVTRRAFSSGVIAAGVAAATRRSALSAYPANERVRLGILGVGNRGDQLIDAFKPDPRVQFGAICDVYDVHREMAAKKVGGSPVLEKDYRKVLDRKDLDAILIATPDHWHALQFIEACQAGKDVYVEKPLSLTISEGRAMVQAAKKVRDARKKYKCNLRTAAYVGALERLQAIYAVRGLFP